MESHNLWYNLSQYVCTFSATKLKKIPICDSQNSNVSTGHNYCFQLRFHTSARREYSKQHKLTRLHLCRIYVDTQSQRNSICSSNFFPYHYIRWYPFVVSSSAHCLRNGKEVVSVYTITDKHEWLHFYFTLDRWTDSVYICQEIRHMLSYLLRKAICYKSYLVHSNKWKYGKSLVTK